MITREEVQAVLNSKERQSAQAVKDQAKKTIEFASRQMKKGVFHIANGSNNPEVIRLVQKAFKKEGICVKVEQTDSQSKSRHKRVYTRKTATYRFSLIEE